MFSRSRLRRLAACVLVVWLLGLASGVVNACIVAAGTEPAAHAGHVHEAADAGDTGHDHEGAPGKTPCERVCDEAKAPQADRQQSTPLSGLWLAAAPLPTLTVRPPVAPSHAHVRGALREAGAVPIPIAYLRLAL
ncbi:hypothetical protein [Ramlibacter sp.]|uniref:hypothetical protein n=1 Tax=Ramlibacter sp. TaxID=1917967 RepID=UPI002B8B2EDE|nr:hypothetical protein [Ramlibacter sp.]HWI82936.1 hypothetical protein [Ramlibacter sp.]